MSPARRPRTRLRPDRRTEVELLASHALVGGMDEVGAAPWPGP